jgi:hypothetical protein
MLCIWRRKTAQARYARVRRGAFVGVLLRSPLVSSAAKPRCGRKVHLRVDPRPRRGFAAPTTTIKANRYPMAAMGTRAKRTCQSFEVRSISDGQEALPSDAGPIVRRKMASDGMRTSCC